MKIKTWTILTGIMFIIDVVLLSRNIISVSIILIGGFAFAVETYILGVFKGFEK